METERSPLSLCVGVPLPTVSEAQKCSLCDEEAGQLALQARSRARRAGRESFGSKDGAHTP